MQPIISSRKIVCSCFHLYSALHSGLYDGFQRFPRAWTIPKIKEDKFLKGSHPEAKKKMCLPDQLELVMEDGTVYRVRSFFAAEQQMEDVLDTLSLESGELNSGTLPSGIHSRAVV